MLPRALETSELGDGVVVFWSWRTKSAASPYVPALCGRTIGATSHAHSMIDRRGWYLYGNDVEVNCAECNAAYSPVAGR